MGRRDCRFAASEPVIVLATIALICLIIGVGAASVARWPVLAGISMAVGLFTLLLVCFWMWACRGT
ncbi:MAG TPA: hypothetical protein VK934_07355 [Fimbriimonas sp.]|nr:hypothetical protein [Fimbriimonas sp.]